MSAAISPSSPSPSTSSPSSAPPLPPSLLPITSPTDPSIPALTSLLLSTTPSLRFSLELEFVSLLASPLYLHHLATSQYLQSPSFLTYLLYLRSVWTHPPYLQHVQYPHALGFLHRLCDSAAFRAALLRPDYCELLHSQQYWTWRSARYNRYRREEERKHHLADEEKGKEEEGGGEERKTGKREGAAQADKDGALRSGLIGAARPVAAQPKAEPQPAGSGTGGG